MYTTLLVLHIFIVIALVVVILLQHSQDGGLVTSQSSNFMSVRGAKNVITRLTAILVTAFFISSLILVVVGTAANPTNRLLHTLTPAQAGKASSSGVRVGKPIQLTIPPQNKKAESPKKNVKVAPKVSVKSSVTTSPAGKQVGTHTSSVHGAAQQAGAAVSVKPKTGEAVHLTTVVPAPSSHGEKAALPEHAK